MSLSNIIQTSRVSSPAVSVAPALQRAQDDFAQQMQTVLQAVNDKAPEAGQALTPVLAQVSQAVESMFAQLQASLSGQGVSQPAAARSAVSDVAASSVSPGLAQTTPRNYLLPGESGAGLPANYRNSPLYQEWLAQKPLRETSGVNYSQDLSAWQKANPYYIDPDRYDNFDDYLAAVQVSTASDNIPAMADPARFSSFLTSYYGPAASVNPWTSRLGKIDPQAMQDWTQATREQYDKALAAQRSVQALERAGLLVAQAPNDR